MAPNGVAMTTIRASLMRNVIKAVSEDATTRMARGKYALRIRLPLEAIELIAVDVVSAKKFLTTMPSSSWIGNLGDVRPSLKRKPKIAYMIAKSISGLSRSEEHTSELQSRQYLVCRL